MTDFPIWRKIPQSLPSSGMTNASELTGNGARRDSVAGNCRNGSNNKDTDPSLPSLLLPTVLRLWAGIAEYDRFIVQFLLKEMKGSFEPAIFPWHIEKNQKKIWD